MLDLSIVIVTYRGKELVRACLDSVLTQTSEPAFEVLVVDNASDDGTPEMIERDFPQVRLIRSERNLGYAAANNLAARHARAEYLVLLNPDTVVLDRALERLLAFARDQRGRGLYGGRTQRPTGELDPRSCWGAQTPWSALCFATGLSTAFRGHPLLDPESLGRWQRDSVRDVGLVTGCLLLLERALWQELGGFDERFFMYGEDADLALRARRCGHPVRITPTATVVHVFGGSATSNGAKMSSIMKGRATLMRKHWSPHARAFGLSCLLSGALLRALGRNPMWRDVWRSRRDWLGGYSLARESAPATPASPTTSRNA